jgi:hypothetical protein
MFFCAERQFPGSRNPQSKNKNNIKDSPGNIQHQENYIKQQS